jgi:hypothetical protein
MIFCIPLIALIMSLTYFFGWALTNQQHILSAARYAAWADVVSDTGVTEGTLNALFLRQTGKNLQVLRDQGPQGVRQDLASTASQANQQLGAYASNLLLQSFPGESSVDVAVEFYPQKGFWSRFTGEMHGRTAREGVPWRITEVGCEDCLTDAFLDSLDAILPANTAGNRIRQLYRASWSP